MTNYNKIENLLVELIELNQRKIGNRDLAVALANDYANAQNNNVIALLKGNYHTWRVANTQLRDTFEKKQVLMLLTEVKLQIR